MLLNLWTIILLFLSDTNGRFCANLPRMSVRAPGSIQINRYNESSLDETENRRMEAVR